MTFQALKRKFIRDLKTSWKKTAILCALLAVGFYMWIPQLIGAMTGNGSKKPAMAQATVKNKQKSTSSRNQANPTSAANQSEQKPLSWQEADTILRLNPLVRSAEVATLPGNPFRVDRDQFPPPVLFAEPDPTPKPEPKPKPATTPVEKKPIIRSFDKLVIKSTMIGQRRRAAFINKKLYLEGSRLEFEGEVYRIQSVRPRFVTLRQGKQTWDIKIADRNISRSIQVERIVPPAELTQPQ